MIFDFDSEMLINCGRLAQKARFQAAFHIYRLC